MAVTNASGNGEPVDPVLIVRSYLATAIQIGAPVYNSGDPRGCYEVYACTARMLLKVMQGADSAKEVLKESLEWSSVIGDVNEQAWIMRRAFDAELAGGAGEAAARTDAP